MNRIQRTIFAIVLLCVPLLSMAQGFKCKQSDGSISYQDHACAAGTASSSALPADLGGGEQVRRSLPPAGALDAKCQQSLKQAMSVCLGRMDTTLKRCQATTMSATCRAQMDGPRGGPHDAACVKQGLGCLTESLQGTQACIQGELPAACRQQFDAAMRKRGH